MKIYTKTGDRGDTGLFGGARVSKADARVEAYGTVDELNSVLGWACAAVTSLPESAEVNASLVKALPLDDTFEAQPEGPARFVAVLQRVQIELFDLGAELASDPTKRHKLFVPLVTEVDVQRLESFIDQAEAQLSPLTTFVLPGGAELSGRFHIARSVCRRAERCVVGLANADAADNNSTTESSAAMTAERELAVRGEVLRYLNRLSDLLFSWARFANQLSGVSDVPWQGRTRAQEQK